MYANTMIELRDLSRVGFGSYRVSVDEPRHADALVHALRSGCNLVDTSANYTNTRSEALIGRVASEHPELDFFVITKAGYVQGENLAVLADLNRAGLARDEVVAFSDDYRYTIHPDFLRCQVELSRRRLQRQRIDGFLLHNPEHYFEQPGGNREEYYARLRKAFECLEELVRVGAVRYYGISSNTFPYPPDHPDATDIACVVDIAQRVSTEHHCRLVQFPFNLYETGALEPHHGGLTMIEFARAHGLVTFANRPLNAKAGGAMVRLATYERQTADLDDDRDEPIFADCVEQIGRQLRLIGSTDDPMEFTVVRFLRDHWKSITTTDLVIQIFHEQLGPFLRRLYEDGMPPEAARAFARLEGRASQYAKRAMSDRARAGRRALVVAGTIDRDDPRPLASIACQYPLNAGIDHVLVGMREIAYVDELKPLFLPRRTEPAHV